MCIVTGPRIDLAIALIDRMKKLFASSNTIAAFDTKETVIELNNVKIEAFPSHHLDAMRGLSRCLTISRTIVWPFVSSVIEISSEVPTCLVITSVKRKER